MWLTLGGYPEIHLKCPKEKEKPKENICTHRDVFPKE